MIGKKIVIEFTYLHVTRPSVYQEQKEKDIFHVDIFRNMQIKNKYYSRIDI